MVTTDAVGGVWNYSLELARGFVRRGTQVMLAVLGPGPTPAQRDQVGVITGVDLRLTDLPLDWTAETPAALDAASERLAGMAADARVASVHLHTPAFIGSARWDVPVIAVAHSCIATWWHSVHRDALPPHLAWRAAAMAHGLNRAYVVVAPSASFAAALRACYRLERDIRVIHNGLEPFNAQAERLPVALTAGRLWDEGKGIATLDAAAARLPYAVLAAGPCAGPDGGRIAYCHLQLIGNLDRPMLAQAYAGAAAFASVARYEPFGLAVLEAAQAGCALVLSDIPTFRELWNGAATFVPADEPVILAEALGALLADPAECDRLGRVARDRSRDFDAESMVAATLALHATSAVRV
jgi:glycosyltransferase involved in cell wall biosynthesis